MSVPTDARLDLFLAGCKKRTRQLNAWALAMGMGWVLVMMCLTTLDVAGRYFFSRPVPGTIEMSQFMLAVFGILGMAYTHGIGANVRVTLFTGRLPRRLSLLITAVTDLLSLQIVSMLAWYAGVMAVDEFTGGTTTDTLAIPIYPLYMLLAVGAFLLALEILVNFMVCLVGGLRGGRGQIFNDAVKG